MTSTEDLLAQFESWDDDELVLELDDSGEGLTAFELQFCADMIEHVIKSGRRLSEAQRVKLCQIVAERCPE